MNKISIVALLVGSAFILSGCGETRTSDVKSSYSMPEGMEGCKVYFLKSQTSLDIYVVRCPLTTTTSESHSCGKGCIQHNNITTDNF